VALITGRRLSEIADLRWKDIRIARNGIVTITFPQTKGNKVMRDMLPAGVSSAIKDYVNTFYGANLATLPPSAALWVSLSRQNYGVALHSNWLERIAKARLGINFHSLRHTFARTLEDAGAKVSEIQARLGHESLATTGRYLAALRRAENPHANRLADMFGLGEVSEPSAPAQADAEEIELDAEELAGLEEDEE
jgi:integrase/recombinase XerD